MILCSVDPTHGSVGCKTGTWESGFHRLQGTNNSLSISFCDVRFEALFETGLSNPGEL